MIELIQLILCNLFHRRHWERGANVHWDFILCLECGRAWPVEKPRC